MGEPGPSNFREAISSQVEDYVTEPTEFGVSETRKVLPCAPNMLIRGAFGGALVGASFPRVGWRTYSLSPPC